MTEAAAPSTTDATNDRGDLDAVLAEHALWLETEGKEGKRANFRGMDLSGVQLAGHRLAEASLRGAHLSGANLSGCDLHAADLAEAVLENADMRGALLAGAMLTGAQLRQANFTDADLTAVDLSAANAERAQFQGAKMQNAVLRDAHLRHADFTGAHLSGAQMRGANFVYATMDQADLSGADCRDVNFNQSRFHGAHLQDANFRGAMLENVDLHAADFSLAMEVGAEFQTQSLQLERSKLQDEHAQLEKLRASFEMREATLGEEKMRADRKFNLITAIEADQQQLIRRLQRYALGFILRFACWAVLCCAGLAATAYTAMKIENPDVVKLSVLVGGLLLVMLLSFLSMLRSAQTVRLLKQFARDTTEKLSADQVAPLASSSSAIVSAVLPPEPTLTVEPKKMASFGFGKKK